MRALSCLLFLSVFLNIGPLLSDADAQTYKVSHNVPAPTTGNAQTDFQLLMATIQSKGYMTYSWFIPDQHQGCPIKEAKWEVAVLVNNGLDLTSDYFGEGVYVEWYGLIKALFTDFFTAAQVQMLQQPNPMQVIKDSPAKKEIFLAPAPFGGWAGATVITLRGAKVDATYECPGSSDNNSSSGNPSPPPSSPPPCLEKDKKEWCVDGDYDGQGFSYADPGFKKITSCNQPPFITVKEKCPVITGFGKCKASEIWSYVPNCDDACPNTKKPLELWYWDGDIDGKGVKKTDLISSCGPPSAKKDTKGQWANEAGDDCDDVKGVFQKTAWYWDEDQDNHGDPSTKTTVCVKPKPKNNKGHWILNGGDSCDQDPDHTAKENWYRDKDYDGFAADDAKAEFGCKSTIIPAPGQGQWVTKKGDECDAPNNPPHKAVQNKKLYYPDGDGDGVPSEGGNNKKKFCTDEEAKASGYLPKQYKKQLNIPGVIASGNLAPGLGPQVIWDQCDDNPATTDYLLYYTDDDEDGLGSGEPIHLCVEPSEDVLLSETDGDCDDHDDMVAGTIMVFRDLLAKI